MRWVPESAFVSPRQLQIQWYSQYVGVIIFKLFFLFMSYGFGSGYSTQGLTQLLYQLQAWGFFRTERVWGGVRSRISGETGVEIVQNNDNR